ncbi:2-oxo acid dehydrogenase subunit E2 [Telmatocola sphagniphila]|uniref:Dihydrolipoamide acetyltransferase component of pyruvate dehydrogenase complex n=1 Tax=Telmatocola sphagniphila TaxID=1123043 RepID=A0A8E6BD76_9BACT|nr:dihydrolipoamide acetyltransferase family protein [Telmatocola sphagniphila]QVL34775.1 2-oxo acid dehydrogenase subunit E2 [Telmatocola sphagniphila]
MNFPLPQIGEGLYEAELVRWLVKVGDIVKPGQSLMEVMTDKATMEVPAPFKGKISSLSAEPGSKIKVGQVILDYESDGSASSPPEPLANQSIEQSSSAPLPEKNNTAVREAVRSSRNIAAAPSVRYLARKMGINLAEVIGSGPAGRILIDDLSRILQSNKTVERKKPSSPNLDLGTPGTTVKLAGLRRKIAEHLSHSKKIIPHYSYVEECDVSELVRLRKSLREPLLEKNIKLTFLPFFVKAAAMALKQVPIVNSSLDDETETIRFHASYNIGIAVATPNGLIVPVIKDADKKDALTIAREIDALSESARQGKVKVEDLKGGTFTVSSVGNIGGLISTPIINHPEVGILGIGKISKRPVYDEDGKLKPAEMVFLSFSFDHRVVDGAIGAMFANKLIDALQKPAIMLIKN